MDIAGAKALKQRLGSNGVDEARPAIVDVPADAPPVFRWVGVKQATPETPATVEDDGPDHVASMFRRLGLSLR